MDFDPSVQQMRFSEQDYNEHLRAQINGADGPRTNLVVKVQGRRFHLNQQPFLQRSETMRQELQQRVRDSI